MHRYIFGNILCECCQQCRLIYSYIFMCFIITCINTNVCACCVYVLVCVCV